MCGCSLCFIFQRGGHRDGSALVVILASCEDASAIQELFFFQSLFSSDCHGI